MRARTVGALLVLPLLAGACGRLSEGASDAPTSTPAEDGGGGINFAYPIGGMEIPNQEFADENLPFAPIVPPTSIGPLVRTVMTDPERSEPHQRGIAWVIDGGDGLFYIVEGPAGGMDQSELEELAECGPKETGCTVEGWSLVKLSNGTTALLVDGAVALGETTFIEWLNGELKFEIIGPRLKFTAEEALSAANELVAVGG